MKLFIDTANVDEIRKANDLGVICGVTTNPSLIAKEGRIFEEVVKEITSIVDGPISAEVISLESEKMVEEGATAKAGDGVCVLEAMKLFNPVKATEDCKIVRFLVQPGENVTKGSPIAEIE